MIFKLTLYNGPDLIHICPSLSVAATVYYKSPKKYDLYFDLTAKYVGIFCGTLVWWPNSPMMLLETSGE